MQPEEQIIFVAEMLDIINRLQELISDHCRSLAEELEPSLSERTSEYDENPFKAETPPGAACAPGEGTANII